MLNACKPYYNPKQMRQRKFEPVDLETILEGGRQQYCLVGESDQRFPYKASVILIGTAAVLGSVVVTYGIYEFSSYVVEPVIKEQIEPTDTPVPETTPTASARPSITPTDLPSSVVTKAP